MELVWHVSSHGVLSMTVESLFAGMAHIYDDETWELVVSVDLAVNTSTFINDVIVTKTAAYFTDSFQGQIYVVRNVAFKTPAPV